MNTNDGSCIEADYAVMTFSLGVLQHNAIDFEPPLPAWKKSAISSFELGTYTKIFMQFDEAFWDDTQYILWADPHERGYYPQYQPLNLEGVLPGSGILIATVVNKQAYKVEVQTNEETQAEVMAALRKIYGDDIPDPKEIYYPRWSQEPWYLTSTYVTPQILLLSELTASIHYYYYCLLTVTPLGNLFT